MFFVSQLDETPSDSLKFLWQTQSHKHLEVSSKYKWLVSKPIPASSSIGNDSPVLRFGLDQPGLLTTWPGIRHPPWRSRQVMAGR